MWVIDQTSVVNEAIIIWKFFLQDAVGNPE